jgi:hypothetical protein
MPHLSFSELIKHRVPLTAAEAVALTLAVARALDMRRADHASDPVPGDDSILLDNTGQVTLAGVHVSTDADESAALAALLRRLLQLDESDAGERRGRVPGALLILLARALGQIDLPAPTPAEFRAAIARFAGTEPPSAAMLAAVFWRAASLRPAIGAGPKGRLLLPPAPPAVAASERRSHGLSRTELRRALRDLEREVFERPGSEAEMIVPKLELLPPAPPSRDPRAAVAGALVGAMLVAMIAGSGLLDRVPDGAEPALPASPAVSYPELAAPPPPQSVPVLTRALIGRDVFSPSFDPKGHAIYFHAGRAAAPLMRASMTETGEIAGITKLLDDGAANYHVTVSPRGDAIAFDSDRHGLRGVYVAGVDGRNARRISGSGYASVPSWSPDGERIAFVKAEPEQTRVWNVWIAGVEGGPLQRVTDHRMGQPWGASWFPDGRRLAYSREQQLVLLDLASGRSTVIASPRRGRLVRTPAVSPDGSRVVFQVHGDGAWMLDVQRMMLRRILPDPSAEEFVWAPDGRTIAYHARGDDGWSVWTIGV